MIETEINDIPQLLEEANIILTSDFSEKEVYDAIMQMEKNKTPRPDGTTAELLIDARLLVTGKNKPVTGNHTSGRRINDRRWCKI
jgi:hypothetical protein